VVCLDSLATMVVGGCLDLFTTLPFLGGGGFFFFDSFFAMNQTYKM